MNKKNFQDFVAKTLDELRLYAEIHADKSVSGEMEFRWLRKDCEWVVNLDCAPVLFSMEGFTVRKENVIVQI